VNGLGSTAGSGYDGVMPFRPIPLLIALTGLIGSAEAVEWPADRSIQVCPALANETRPPMDYDRPDCWSADLHDIDVQDQTLWLRLRFQAPADNAAFVGLLISMKAASEVFIDGELIGRNGVPGRDARNELPGPMDAVIPINFQQLDSADHVVDLKVSSHHNWLTLRHPIHGLALVDYPSQQDRTLRYYLPSLLPMGVFILAVFYFGSLTVRSEERVVPALFCALAGLAALQLFLEASRGLFAYRYPVQDLRLIGILLCSIGFGSGLVAIHAKRFWPKRNGLLIGLTALVMGAVIALTASWDARTAMVLLAGTTVAFLAALIGWRRGRPMARAHVAALSLFLLANLIYPDRFIDHGFYLLVALFLVGLMVLQAVAFAREREGQIEQRLRADQLQRALDQTEAERRPQTLNVPGTGRVQTVRVDDLVRIQGAGDYVELHLEDGSELLHSATLNEIDADLPSHFLRVHRSHLVNTRCIERLDRNDTGTGILHLNNGQTVPVSRRIMPGVRRALQ
jgi:protein-S-isoprenylcysteine O-methyltransferase Ste14